MGGFFELELPKSNASYHSTALKLSTGRACLRVIIQTLGIKKCFVPYYACNSVYDSFIAESVELVYYEIDDKFQPLTLPELGKNEYFLCINYFGVTSSVTEGLIAIYGERLIIDNTHLFFHKGYSNNFSFTSARKYFGVADGAYLYSPNSLAVEIQNTNAPDFSPNILKFLGKQEIAYDAYREYERSIDCSIKKMSTLSERLLSLIDYTEVQRKRKANFQYLHEQLSLLNQLSLTSDNSDITAFVYPFLPEKNIEKSLFHSEKIFIPSLWLDPLHRDMNGYAFEKDMASRLCPIPIDHRYSEDDLERIVELIRKIV
jgi:hypothetical protein